MWSSGDCAWIWYATCQSAIQPLLIAEVKDFGGLVTVRLLLGIAEAGIFPGCRSYTTLSGWRLN